ncbi:hypothetical protein TKK_0007616 [Trichogramma kaykai]
MSSSSNFFFFSPFARTLRVFVHSSTDQQQRGAKKLKSETAKGENAAAATTAATKDNNAKLETIEKQQVVEDKRVFKLKTPIILGCLIYAFVLSLPTIYDYFFYEEEEEEDEDSYEDLSYVEIAIDYVVISVQQVIGGIWQAFDNLFLSTSKCKKCSRGGTIF